MALDVDDEDGEGSVRRRRAAAKTGYVEDGEASTRLPER